MSKAGVDEIAFLIGAETAKECMRSLLEIMRAVRVKGLFDPGFRNEGNLYAEFLKLIGERGVTYRVVRTMENFSLGKTRFYIMRPGSINAGHGSSGNLYLCVIHGGNSFILSRGIHGCGSSPSRLSQLLPVDSSEFLFDGSTALLRVTASHRSSRYPLVVESDGSEITVRSLQRISVSLRGAVPDKASERQRPDTIVPSIHRATGATPGMININTVPASKLEELSGIGVKRAKMIVEFREANGQFRNINEIKKVPGIGEKLFQRNRERICIR